MDHKQIEEHFSGIEWAKDFKDLLIHKAQTALFRQTTP